MGEDLYCQIQDAVIDASAFRRQLHTPETAGGVSLFEGIIRNQNDGKAVIHLEYEAYASLALKEMRRIRSEAMEIFGLVGAYQVHRVGRLAIGETAVIIAALAKHRNEAFSGCRYMIDQLKARVPIWKKEFYQDGTYQWTRCSHTTHE